MSLAQSNHDFVEFCSIFGTGNFNFFFIFHQVEEEVCEEATEMGCRIVEREVIVNEKQQVCKVKRVPQCRPIERVNCKLPVPAEIPPKTCTQVCLPR